MNSPCIEILPRDIVESIAAGEVIERPAHILKELIENSLDADSNRIEVDIGDGWKQGEGYIIIRDDGRGIIKEDLALIFERYATSKIRQEEDIYRLKTLGFRGEALASISAVSRIKVRSRVEDMDWGYEVESEFGRVSDIVEVGMPEGTEVEVKYLFIEKPVRRKFLKSDVAEFRECYKNFIRLALFYPEVHFVLKHNDRNLFNLIKDEFPSRERTRNILGDEVSDELIEVEHSGEKARVSGFVSNASITKSNSTNMFFALNRRPFNDRGFTYHLLNIYRGLLPKGRYPITVINFDVSPDEYDVNVHPRKEEVRFHRKNFIDGLMSTAVKSSLIKGVRDYEKSFGDKRRENLRKFSTEDIAEINEMVESARKMREVDLAEPSDEVGLFEGDRYKYIGSLWQTYLMVEEVEELVLIDQHATAERKLYDELMSILDEGKSEGQPQMLLIPRPIFCSPDRREVFDEHGDIFEELGFRVDEFGTDTILLRGVPQILPPHNEVELLSDVLDEISGADMRRRYRSVIEEIVASIACHKSLRARDLVSREEALSLLDFLYSLPEDDRTCPHGRPLTINLTRGEVERQFGR